MKKIIALVLAVIMLVSIVPVSAIAVGAKEAEQDKYLAGLADPTFTKTTANYDGYHFKVGTKAVWDCKLYTLSATVTKVNGNFAAFTIKFNSKVSEECTPIDGGWRGYHIYAFSNVESKEYSPSDTMTLIVNTAKIDPFSSSSAAGGMQFIKIRVEKHAYDDDVFPLYSGSTYFADIAKNRKVYPENAGSISEVYVEDTYALGYYVKPLYKINTNAIKVAYTAISFGTYAFPCHLYYRAKGAKTWAKKSFGAKKAWVLSGLKANTVYEIKPVCVIPFKDPETNESKYVLDLVCNPFYLTTAINQIPYLSAVKISGVKYGKKTIPAHWGNYSDGRVVWIPAETLNTCTYTLTLSMRAVPANAKGLYIKVGGAAYYLKGRKGTYSTRMTFQGKGNLKGKKIAAAIAYSSNTIGYAAVGIGSARTIHYRLRNEVTNYKK